MGVEYLGLYDKDKNKLSESFKREKGKKINVPKGTYYGVVLIIIENSNGEYLIQMTSKEKNSVYALTGGHVQDSQTPLEAVICEVEEELGYKLDLNDVSLFKTYQFDDKFLDVFYVNKNINIDELIYQKTEVEYVKYLNKEEIFEIIENNLIRGSSIKPIQDYFQKKDVNLKQHLKSSL